MRMFLIRHGESLGNVDKRAYKERRDHNVPLTKWGHEQAVEAGRFLEEYYANQPELADRKIRVWHSPYVRTTQTKDGILQSLSDDRIESVCEDYLLREQEFGLFSEYPDREMQEKLFPEECARYYTDWEKKGKFYASPPEGESPADVAMRTRIFNGTLMRDMEQGQEDLIVVSHGVTTRTLEMNFLHKEVDWFEKSPNPGNCDIILIEGDRENGYTATRVFEGKLRPAHLPKDHKATPHGEEPARSVA